VHRQTFHLQRPPFSNELLEFEIAWLGLDYRQAIVLFGRSLRQMLGISQRSIRNGFRGVQTFSSSHVLESTI